MKKLLQLSLLLTLILTLALPMLATERPEVARAVTWLLDQQQSNGGFTNGFAAGSDLGATVEVILASVAAGEDPHTWTSSPLDYLQTQVVSGAVQDTGGWSHVLLGAVALGADPHNFGGVDLVESLLATADPVTGRFGDSLYAHAYALLALHNAGAEITAGAVELLLQAQTSAGAWPMFDGDSVDTNTTALAVQALVATGEEEAARDALIYFQAMQNDDGGFPWQKPSDFGTDSDANSTSVVLQALTALGEAPDDWQPEGSSPLDALLALWEEESGGYRWQAAIPGANVLATAQAVQAVAGLNLTEVAQSAAAEPAPLLPASGGTPWKLYIPLSGLLLIVAGLLLHRQEANTGK
ncbi:MAG: prenyltransferase/squalene oxidase repeat-containing protein [Chloroflexota bacterium]|nr:prenyltransferase/squalene oxidase repeat-containing protein [Chloroflexota bacterium]